MKKLLSAILTLALVLCLGMPALAAEPEAAQEPAPGPMSTWPTPMPWG